MVQPLEKALLLFRPVLDSDLLEAAGEMSPPAFGTAREDLKLVELVHANFIWRRRDACWGVGLPLIFQLPASCKKRKHLHLLLRWRDKSRFFVEGMSIGGKNSLHFLNYALFINLNYALVMSQYVALLFRSIHLVRSKEKAPFYVNLALFFHISLVEYALIEDLERALNKFRSLFHSERSEN